MTVMTNVVLVLKDSEGNIGIVKTLTDNDIIKIANAITDVGQVVDPATHMPIEATTASVGVVQLATAQDITNGTANKVVDAKELIDFAQTLPAANGVTDVSSGDNSNQLVVSRIGGSKTLTIDNVEHADNADEATHAAQADTATSANSVAWDKVSGKPNTFAPATHNHDDRYYTESEIDTKLSGKSDTTHNHNSAYLGITAKAESAKSADSVAWTNVSGKPSSYTPSSHTHDDRYYTESEIDTKLGGKANTSGALFTVNGLAKPGWSKIGTGEGGSCIQVKTTDNTYPSICFHRSGHSHCVLAESSGQLGTMQEGNGTFNHLITSANIGSQSVNYANSAGYANSANSVAWGNVQDKPSSFTPAAHNHDSTYLKLSGGTITGTISKNNNSSSWVQGRAVAPFRTIAASSPGDSQYVPCWSAKSYQGSWDCGPYTSNILHLSYITDANFNSNNNAQSADFTFATDGTFNATTLKENGTKLADKYQPKGSYVSTSTIWVG